MHSLSVSYNVAVGKSRHRLYSRKSLLWAMNGLIRRSKASNRSPWVSRPWFALRKPPARGSRLEWLDVEGTAMIRAMALRALVLTAAFVAGLTPVTCLGANGNQLPAKATQELPPE